MSLMSKNEAQSKNEAHFDRCSFISIIATAPAFIVTNSMEYTTVGEFETQSANNMDLEYVRREKEIEESV